MLSTLYWSRFLTLILENVWKMSEWRNVHNRKMPGKHVAALFPAIFSHFTQRLAWNGATDSDVLTNSPLEEVQLNVQSMSERSCSLFSSVFVRSGNVERSLCSNHISLDLILQKPAGMCRVWWNKVTGLPLNLVWGQAPAPCSHCDLPDTVCSAAQSEHVFTEDPGLVKRSN